MHVARQQRIPLTHNAIEVRSSCGVLSCGASEVGADLIEIATVGSP
jgi:hypothetical protein